MSVHHGIPDGMRFSDTYGCYRPDYLPITHCPEHPGIRLGWCYWPHQDKKNDNPFAFEDPQHGG